MSMLKATTAVFAIMLAVCSAGAQTFTFGWNPRSGDAWVDAWLGDMNRYGERYRDAFIDEIVRYHDAPRDLIEDLLRRHWAPGDLYFACALAKLAGHPCRDVVDLWERDHDLGWGNIAKQLGIKPGSPEFHRLKRGMVPTYDRWGRPIDLDPQLERDFPGRGKGSKHGDDHGREGNIHDNGPGDGARTQSNSSKAKGKGKE